MNVTILITHFMCFLGIHSVLSMFKPKKCGGEEDYQFLKQFATNSKLKVMLSCMQPVQSVQICSLPSHMC